MRKWSRNRQILTGVAVIVALLALYAVYVSRTTPPEPQTVAITEILNWAEKQQITEARVAGDVVTVTTANGEQYRALKENNQPVSEALRLDGVKVTVSGPDQTGVPSALVALVPFLFLMGLLWF
ncbi:MAG: hypothetical protein ACYC7H_15930, partial [Chloroflexota bacterium]